MEPPLVARERVVAARVNLALSLKPRDCERMPIQRVYNYRALLGFFTSCYSYGFLPPSDSLAVTRTTAMYAQVVNFTALRGHRGLHSQAVLETLFLSHFIFQMFFRFNKMSLIFF